MAKRNEYWFILRVIFDEIVHKYIEEKIRSKMKQDEVYLKPEVKLQRA